MEHYSIFVLVALLTVLSPGPGVVLTLTNTIRYGTRKAAAGIVGIAFGTFIIAGISATSLGLILATSALAFTIMKFIGAAYLVYLGIKLWRAPATGIKIDTSTNTKAQKRQFLEGLTIQVTNPKAVFFFMSVFPQFIHFQGNYTSQFIVLVLTYSCLVITIHFLYSLLAKSTRGWLSSDRGRKLINRCSGSTFILFGIGLASASR